MNDDLPHDLLDFVAASPIPITLAKPGAPDRVLVAANPRFCEMTGYAEADILGRDCRFLQGEKTTPESRLAMRRFFETPGPGQTRVSIVNYCRDRAPFVNLVFLSKLTGVCGELRLLLASQFDASHATAPAADAYDRALGREIAHVGQIGRAHRLGIETSFASLAASARAIAAARLALAELQAGET